MTYSFMLAKEYSSTMKLPKELSNSKLPIGWLLSEKYDGYRARFVSENKSFVSRAQKGFNAPQWFKDAMIPSHDLDGELWAGRENFQDMGVVRKKIPEPIEWIKIKFIVYDLPEYNGNFKKRIDILKELVQLNDYRWNIIRNDLEPPFNTLESPLIFAPQIVIQDLTQFKSIYESILKKGGEGVMIKDPNSLYEDKRSNFLLKYKPNFDAEALIVDYTEGKGKYKGLLGGFVCKPLINYDDFHYIDENENHVFTISGMDDEVRANYKLTHPIGTIISYEHSGLTDSGKPRFARYIRTRDDITLKDKPKNTMKKSVEKRDLIITIFGKLYEYEKSTNSGFKAKAYGNAVNSLKNITDDSELTTENLLSMKGIGKSLVEKIKEIIETNTCKMYENVKNFKDPKKIFENIHAVGPKKAKELVTSGFTTIDSLRNHPDVKSILNDKQLIGLKFYDDILARIPRGEIIEHEIILKKVLAQIDKNAELTIAGSFRRGKEDSGDIDVLLKSKNKSTYKKFIEKLTEMKYLYHEHLALGPKKYNGLAIINGCLLYRRIDIMYTTPEEYPFAILYFTGSMEFNAKMRGIVLERGLSMNEYSLKDNETKKIVEQKFYKEKDIFDYLNMEWVEPVDR